MESETIMTEETKDIRQVHPAHRARRPAWREDLVQVERGLVVGVRSDSAFFAHFFGGSIVIAAATVLGLGLVQWTMVLVSLTVVLTAQMFHQALKALAQNDGMEPTPAQRKAIGMGTAAVTVALAGAAIGIGLIFWQRMAELFE